MLSVSQDFMLAVSLLFSSAWKIATSFQIPGTNINIPEFMFACLMMVFGIKVVPSILGFASWWRVGDARRKKASQESGKAKSSDKPKE